MRIRERLARLQLSDWLALGLLFAYGLIFSWLTIRQHQSFNTNALDLAKFDQSIWNTAQGRPYQITISENLVIQSHFSPALALFAPLYWIWPDVRLLFVAQSLLLGGAGFLIYWFFRRDNPWLGLAVFAAYLMHPSLHQVNLMEFRRITLAVFATSFALYHMLRRRYGWMALGLALALLSKEDMSLTAVAFGLYILLVQRRYRVGAAALAVGLAWFVLVPFGLLPAIMPHDAIEGYQHAGSYFAYLGTSLPEIINTVLTRPGALWEYAGQVERVTAVFNFLWPTAFLFLLAPALALLMLPHFAYLLVSTADAMGRLQAWYPSVLLVLLFWAVALGAARIRQAQRRHAALVVLLLASGTAWLLNSQLWPGRHFDAERYAITAHERQVEAILRTIPTDAIVMAQDPLVPHLSHRTDIYLFPWTRGGNQPDYLIFDTNMRTYPLGPDEFRSLFYDVLAGTDYELVSQAETLYVFRYVGDVEPQVALQADFGESLRLEGYSVTAAPPGEPYLPGLDALPVGTTLRVELLWETLGSLNQNYTVFVHALDGNGRMLGQHDSWPADAHRPTSVLSVGERVRDVHYLTLSEPVAREDIMLRVGLYAPDGTHLPTADGSDFLLTRPEYN